MHRLVALLLTACVVFTSTAFAQSGLKGPSIVWVNEPKPGELPLPTGVSHRTFESELVNQQIGYCIYLPPDYEESPDHYPVIYSLHGNGGNEFRCINAAEILHQGIEAGQWPPMIMVFPNGGHSTFYKNSHDGRFPVESIVLEELIPHIDATFRTVAKNTHRAIEGFSMGGRGATRLAVKHPRVFCSLFCQAGNVPHLLEMFDAAEPGSAPHPMLGNERSRYEADDVYELTRQNAQALKRSVAIQIACGTKDFGHIKTIRDWHSLLQDVGIDHTYIELDGLAHNRTEMMERMRAIWFDHHVRAMAMAQAKRTKRTARAPTGR